MKKLLLTSIILMTGFVLPGQECENAALFGKEGAALEYTSFNKSGKQQGKTVHKTLSINREGDTYISKIAVTTFDKKGKEGFSSEYQASCENGRFSIDMQRFFDNSQLEQYGDEGKFTLEMDGNVLEFPADMTSNDILNDGNFSVRVNSNDFTLVTMTFDVTNRKVVGNETITTAAGTFDCQKVTFDFNSKVGIIKVSGSGVEWYDQDKAIVRSESYNKKGKLISYMELTSSK